MITIERLKEVLCYDPNTGLFIWKISPTNKVKIGDIAGSFHTGGYLQTSIDGVKYYLHRLAWFYMTGKMPAEIDHKNLNKADNKFDNLREATRTQNSLNTRVKRISKTKLKNVYYEKRRSLYRVSARLNGKRHFIGYYKTEDEANEVYEKWARQNHKEWYACAELKNGIVVKVK